MKIDEDSSASTSHVADMPPASAKLLKNIKNAKTTDDFIIEINKGREVHSIMGKTELCRWTEVLNRCDEILEASIKKNEKGDMLCDYCPIGKRNAVSVVRFTVLLFECTSSRRVYRSMDRILALLECSDMELLGEVLRLLQTMGKRSKYLTQRLGPNDQALLVGSLTSIAQCWGGKLRPIKMAACMAKDMEIPVLFPFVFTDGRKSVTVSEPKPEDCLPELVQSYMAQIAPPPTSDATVLQTTKEARYSLLSRLRMLRGFEDISHRFRCLIVRLLSVSTLIYCRCAVEENPVSGLLYSGFIEELVALLKTERDAESTKDYAMLDAVHTEALTTLTSIVNYEKEPKIPQILEALSAGSYHGYLSVLTRQVVDELKNSNLSKPGKPSVALATSLFSFIYHLASIEPGGETLVGSGLTQTLLSVIGFNEMPIELITFGTRCARIIDLFTTIDVTAFKTHNGMEVCVNRIVHEINECRKEQPFMIDLSGDAPFEDNPVEEVAVQVAVNAEPEVEAIEAEVESAHPEVAHVEEANVEEANVEQANVEQADADAGEAAPQDVPVRRALYIEAPPPTVDPEEEVVNDGPRFLSREASVSYARSLEYMNRSRRPRPAIPVPEVVFTGGPWIKTSHSGLFCHQQRSGLIKGLLTFVKRAIGDSQFNDTIRQVMENGLPEALMHILSNAEYYSPSLFHQSAQLITNYVYQNPEELSSLQRRHVPYVLFQCLLRKELPNSKDVITTIGGIFTALCLNQRGLKQFKAYEPFDQIFRIILSVKFLVTMKKKRTDMFDSSQAIGGALDDLLRHNPDLKAEMLKSIIKVLDMLTELGKNSPPNTEIVMSLAKNVARNIVFPNGQTPSVSVPLSVIVGEDVGGVRDEATPVAAQLAADLPDDGAGDEPMEIEDNEDSDVDDETEMSMDEMSGEAMVNVSDANIETTSEKSTTEIALTEMGLDMVCDDGTGKKILPLGDYMILIAKIIETMMTQPTNLRMVDDFIAQGGIEKVLGLCQLPCITSDFAQNNYAASIANVVKFVVFQRTSDSGPRLMNAIISVYIKTIMPLFEETATEFPLLNQAPGATTETQKASVMMHMNEKVVTRTLNNLNNIIPVLLLINKNNMASSFQTEMRNRIFETWKTPEGVKLYMLLRKMSRMMVWECALIRALKPSIRSCATQTESSNETDASVIDPALEPTGVAAEKSEKKDSKEKPWLLAGITQEENDYWSKHKTLADLISKSNKSVSELLNMMARTINYMGGSRRQRRGDAGPLSSSATQCVSMIFTAIYKDLKWEPHGPANSPMVYARYAELLNQLNMALFDDRGRCSNNLIPQHFYTSGCHKAFFELFTEKIVPSFGEYLPHGLEQVMSEWCKLAGKLTDKNCISFNEGPARPRDNPEFDVDKYLKLVCRDMFNAFKVLFEKLSSCSQAALIALQGVCESSLSVFNEVAHHLAQEERDSAGASPPPQQAGNADYAAQQAALAQAAEPARVHDEANIARLMELGFSRDVVIYAVDTTRNADEAANFLIAHGHDLDYFPAREDLNAAAPQARNESSPRIPVSETLFNNLQLAFVILSGQEGVEQARLFPMVGADIPSAVRTRLAEGLQSVDPASFNGTHFIESNFEIEATPEEEDVATPLIPPLSQLNIDKDVSLQGACEQLLPLIKRLLDITPELVFTCGDLIIAIYPSMSEAWRKEVLLEQMLMDDVIQQSELILSYTNEDENNTEVLDISRKLSNRLHFSCLMLEKFSEECIEIAKIKPIIKTFLNLLGYLEQRMKNNVFQGLSSRILLWLDLYDKSQRLVSRRKHLESVSKTLEWSYQVVETSEQNRGRRAVEKKWVVYEQYVQTAINDAFYAGRETVRFTLRRTGRPSKKMLLDFVLMRHTDNGNVRENVKCEIPSDVEIDINSLLASEKESTWTDEENERIIALILQILSKQTLHHTLIQSLLCFVVRLTRNERNARKFMDGRGIEYALRLRTKQCSSGVALVSILVRNCIDDTGLMELAFEKTIRSFIFGSPGHHSDAQNQSRDYFDMLHKMAPLSSRSPSVFMSVMEKITKLNGNQVSLIPKEKSEKEKEKDKEKEKEKDKDKPSTSTAGPSSSTASSSEVVLNTDRAKALIDFMLLDVLEGEFPTRDVMRLVNRDKVLSMIAELLKTYPCLVNAVAESRSSTGKTALHTLMENYIYAPENVETSYALKSLLSVMAGCTNSPKALDSMVNDIKSVLSTFCEKALQHRTAGDDPMNSDGTQSAKQDGKDEKSLNMKITEICGTIIGMLQNVPKMSRMSAEPKTNQVLSKIFQKKKFNADLVKAITYLQVSNKESIQTVNEILKTLNILMETPSNGPLGAHGFLELPMSLAQDESLWDLTPRGLSGIDNEMRQLIRRLNDETRRLEQLFQQRNNVARSNRHQIIAQIPAAEAEASAAAEGEDEDGSEASERAMSVHEDPSDAVAVVHGDQEPVAGEDEHMDVAQAQDVEEGVDDVENDMGDEEIDAVGDDDDNDDDEDDEDDDDEDEDDEDDDDDDQEQNAEPAENREVHRLIDQDEDDDDDDAEEGESMEEDHDDFDTLDDDYIDNMVDDMDVFAQMPRPPVAFSDFMTNEDMLHGSGHGFPGRRPPRAGGVERHPLLARPSRDTDLMRRRIEEMSEEMHRSGLAGMPRSTLHRQNAIRRGPDGRDMDTITRAFRFHNNDGGPPTRMFIHSRNPMEAISGSIMERMFEFPGNVSFSSRPFTSYRTMFGRETEDVVRRQNRTENVHSCLDRLESYSKMMEANSIRYICVIVNTMVTRVLRSHEQKAKAEADVKAKAAKAKEEAEKEKLKAQVEKQQAAQSGLATPDATATTNTVSDTTAPNATRTAGEDTSTTSSAVVPQEEGEGSSSGEPMETGDDDSRMIASSAATAASSVAGVEDLEEVGIDEVEAAVHAEDTAADEAMSPASPDQQPQAEVAMSPDNAAIPPVVIPQEMAPVPEPVIDEAFRAILGDIEIPVGVDPAFLAALPEDMRAEVLRDYQRTQRAERAARPVVPPPAVNAGENAEEPNEAPLVEPINQEFLNALPPELQEEVLAEHERALREATEARRRQDAAAEPVPEMDAAAVIRSLPNNERAQVLAEMDDTELARLPEEMQQEARRARATHNMDPHNMLRYHRLLFRGARGAGAAAVIGGAGGADGATHRAAARAATARHLAERTTVGFMAGKATQAPSNTPQMLDRESLVTLCMLYLVDQRLNHNNLQKVLKNACSNASTCDFVIWCLLSLLDKASEANADDEEIISLVPSWLDSIAVSGVGHNERALKIGENASKVSIHSMLAVPMCKNILDLLTIIAKNYPGNFLPVVLRRQAKTTDVGKQQASFTQFWSMVQNNTKIPKLKDWTASPSEQLEECPLGQMLRYLDKPTIAKTSNLKDKVLKVVSVLMQVLPDDTLLKLDVDEKRYMPLESHLKLVINVVTKGTCSGSGITDGLTAIAEAMRCFSEATTQSVYEHWFEAISSLGQELLPQISRLNEELKEAQKTDQEPNVNFAPDQPSSSKTSQLVVDTSSGGGRTATGRFDGERLVIDGDQNMRLMMSSCKELQLPAVTVLTDKAGAQYSLLSALQTLVKVKTHMRNILKQKLAKEREAKEAAKPPKTATPAPTQDSATPTPVEEQAGPSPTVVEPDLNKMVDDHFEKEPRISEKLAILAPLWESLSECLLRLGKASDPHAVLALQPAAEAFFLVHASRKKTKKAEDSIAKRKESSSAGPSAVVSSMSHEGSLKEDMDPDTVKLLEFAEKHREVLNQALRQNNAVLSSGGPFAVLTQYPKLLDFDVKRKYFRKELSKVEPSQPRYRRNDISVQVQRSRVFSDSFRELFRLRPSEWKNRFYIIFQGEEGQDAGGLLREWFSVITREVFNPNYALFITAPGDMVTYMINKASYINPEHLDYFKFVGRLIAKSVFEHKYLDCYFTRAFYKHILNIPVKYQDLESEDPAFFKSLEFILNNDINDLGLDFTFSTEVEEFGVRSVRDLKPNGRKIEVTDENKDEYVKLVCQMKMTGSIRKQLDAFLTGFYEIIPKDLISMFNEQELELLISGLPTVDIDDLAANTEYKGYQKTSVQIQWFWRALRSFEKEDKAKFLQFVTGTSKVPLQGFSSLEGMSGVQKFSVHMDSRGGDRLPAAHTCFNQLDLPQYDSYEKMRDSLLIAIRECTEGFGFA